MVSILFVAVYMINRNANCQKYTITSQQEDARPLQYFSYHQCGCCDDLRRVKVAVINLAQNPHNLHDKET